VKKLLYRYYESAGHENINELKIFRKLLELIYEVRNIRHQKLKVQTDYL